MRLRVTLLRPVENLAMDGRNHSLHDQLVAAVEAADTALDELGFVLCDCVLCCHAACFREPGEDAARAAKAWTDPDADVVAPVASRGPLRVEEVQAFFADFMTHHYRQGRPRAEVPAAVAEVFGPLGFLLARVPPEAHWFSIDAPGRTAAGVLWDIRFVDVAVAFDGAVTCIHLGYSD